MYDARGDIQDYIEQKIRELLEEPMKKYQDPKWVQADTLFEQLIVPLDIYIMDKRSKDYTTKINFIQISEKIYGLSIFIISI